jgi:hypothetical protein
MRVVSAAAIVLIALGISGCSFEVSAGTYREMSKENLQQTIADKLALQVGQRPDAIECPGGLAAEVERSIRCVLIAGPDRIGLSATVTSTGVEKINFDVLVDERPMSATTESDSDPNRARSREVAVGDRRSR